MTKRIFDFAMSLFGIIILSPVFAIVGLCIKVDSIGPVFYRQKRVGLEGKVFWIYKFRSMVQNSDKLGESLTVGADIRVTKSGQFLRKYKIDELSQLINVLVGDMSLVGPRPEVPEFMQYYDEASRNIILSVKPGITDLASIEFKSESEILGRAEDYKKTYISKIMPVKKIYYLEYVKSHNFIGDIIIIFKTIYSVVFR